MKIKDILAIAAVALMAGGCNSNDETQSDEGRVPIRLTASVESCLTVKASTRGATTAATQDETLLEGQTVKAVITMEGTEYTRNYTVGTGDVLTTDETPELYYPMNGSPVSIYAVHPSYTSESDFTVAIDQRDDALYAASDLCYSKTTSYKKADWNKLTFEHLLSKIVVNITNSVNSNAISSVQLNACIRTSLTYPIDNSDGYTLGPASIPNTVTLNPGAAAIIPPQTISEGTVLIDFTIPDVGFIEYTLPADVTFESGHQYTYNITVSQTGITVTSSINPWGSDDNSPTDPANTYTGSVTPYDRSIPLSSVTSSHIGWVIASDGRVYPDRATAELSGKEGKAMIAYVGTVGSVDNSSYTDTGLHQGSIDGTIYRGLAIDLDNMPGNTVWRNPDYISPTTGNLDAFADCTTLSQAYNDMQGLRHAYYSYLSTRMMACTDAYYRTDLVPGCSSWFLPTAGQWIRVLNQFGANITTSGNLDPITTTAVGTAVFNSLNTTLEAAGATLMEEKTYYWVSTEYNYNHALNLQFTKDSKIIRMPYDSKAATDRLSRDFIAF
jgi:predicted heme/steroid binding protein